MPGLLDVMVDQLPMLTEKGLRELLVATSCELSFRGDVREENEEVRMAHAKGGGAGSPFPPEELLRVVHPEFTGAEREEQMEEAEVEEDFEVEDEPLIAPGDGDRYCGMSLAKNGSFQMVNELMEDYDYGLMDDASGFLWLADSLMLHVHVVILEGSNVGRTQHSSVEPSLMMDSMDQGVACLI